MPGVLIGQMRASFVAEVISGCTAESWAAIEAMVDEVYYIGRNDMKLESLEACKSTMGWCGAIEEALDGVEAREFGPLRQPALVLSEDRSLEFGGPIGRVLEV